MKNRILILATMFIGAFALLAFTVPQEKKKRWTMGNSCRIQKHGKPL